jgi:hypothetical protein
VLLRFAYLAISHAFAALRLLPMSDHDKDIEILALRHQFDVTQRQIAGQRPQLRPEDRAFLAALLLPLARATRPHQHEAQTWPAANDRLDPPSRPTAGRREPRLGYRRPHGERALLGITIAPSTMWEILTAAGIDPAPQRRKLTRGQLLTLPG